MMKRLDGIVSRDLARAMTLAATCTSRDDTRAVLNHVHVARRGEQLIVEATDTCRLALVQMPAPAARWLQPDEGDDWLLPGAVIASAMSTKRARAAALLAIDGDEIAAGGGDAVTIVLMALAHGGLDLQPDQIDALGLTTAQFPEWVG